MPGTSLADRANLTGVAAPTWRGIKARGHFPTEQAALKCLYLVTRSLDPTACQEDLAIYRETGDQYRQGIAFKPKLLGGGMSPKALTWAFASSVAKSSDRKIV
jgi:hypothetical protein